MNRVYTAHMTTDQPLRSAGKALRERMAQGDHARTKSLMSDPSHYASWEKLNPAVRINYLRRQDTALVVFRDWLREMADGHRVSAMALDDMRESHNADLLTTLADLIDKEVGR